MARRSQPAPTQVAHATAGAVALFLFHVLTAGVCFLAFEESEPQIALSITNFKRSEEIWSHGVLCVECAGVDRSHGGCSRGLCRGGSRPLWQPSLQATHRLAIAATAFHSRSTAPRIVVITTTTASAMHTARTSFSAFPKCPQERGHRPVLTPSIQSSAGGREHALTLGDYRRPLVVRRPCARLTLLDGYTRDYEQPRPPLA